MPHGHTAYGQYACVLYIMLYITRAPANRDGNDPLTLWKALTRGASWRKAKRKLTRCAVTPMCCLPC